MQFENQPNRQPTPAAEKETAMFLLDSPEVQIKLSKLWAERKGEDMSDRNAVMQLWIEKGGAKAFQEYVDAHQGESVDLTNEEELTALLDDMFPPSAEEELH